MNIKLWLLTIFIVHSEEEQPDLPSHVSCSISDPLDDLPPPLIFPAKLNLSVEDAKEKCKARIPRHIEHVSAEVANHVDVVIDRLLDIFTKAYPHMPQDITLVVCPYEEHKNSCLYMLEIPSKEWVNGRIYFKCGQSGRCKLRVGKQDPDGTKAKFLLPSPDSAIASGLIDMNDIDAIMGLEHLPLIGAFRYGRDYLRKQVLNQVLELIFLCSYDFNKGSAGEFITRAPSETESKIIDTSFDFPTSQIPAHLLIFEEVSDWDSWKTFDSKIRHEEEFSNLSLFVNPKYSNFLTKHFAQLNVDEDKYGEFNDLVDENPFYKKALPKVKEIRNVLEGRSRRATKLSKIQSAMQSIAKMDEYMGPEPKVHAADTKKKITSVTKRTDNLKTLHRSRETSFTDLCEVDKKFCERAIKDKFIFKRRFLVKDNQGKLVLSEKEEPALTIYIMESCHVFLVRRSHYVALAEKQTLQNRLNALISFHAETVFLGQMGMVSGKTVLDIEKRLLSVVMLLTGITKSLDAKQDEEGFLFFARRYFLSPGVSEPGKPPAYNYLHDAFGIENLQHRAILLLLHTLEEDLFNKLLELFEINISVATYKNKYYLLVGDKTYWRHYDFTKDDASLKSAVALANGDKEIVQVDDILEALFADFLSAMKDLSSDDLSLSSDDLSLADMRCDSLLDEIEDEELMEAIRLNCVKWFRQQRRDRRSQKRTEKKMKDPKVQEGIKRVFKPDKKQCPVEAQDFAFEMDE